MPPPCYVDDSFLVTYVCSGCERVLRCLPLEENECGCAISTRGRVRTVWLLLQAFDFRRSLYDVTTDRSCFRSAATPESTRRSLCQFAVVFAPSQCLRVVGAEYAIVSAGNVSGERELSETRSTVSIVYRYFASSVKTSCVKHRAGVELT